MTSRPYDFSVSIGLLTTDQRPATDDRPTSHLENSNGNISATDYPIHSVFRYKVWFSGQLVELHYFELVQIQ